MLSEFSISPLRALVGSVAAYVAWKVVRGLAFGHPLDNLRGPQASSLVAGNLMDVFCSLEFHRSTVKEYGKLAKIYGLFKKPMLFVSDPKAMTSIFLKVLIPEPFEQHILTRSMDEHQEQHVVYDENPAFLANNSAMFGKSLLATTGDAHKKQRKMLNPVFSVAHIKKMVPTFFSVSNDVVNVLLQKTEGGQDEVDLVPWLTRAAIEIMALSGFDQSLSPVHEGMEEHRYVTAMKLLIPTGRDLLLIREFIVPFIRRYRIGTPAMHRFIAMLLPWKALHTMIGIVDVMHEESQDIFLKKKRELKGLGNDEAGKDILSILMRENSNASSTDRLEDDEVIAQISTLMFAAMDTTSNALCRTFWLLSQRQDVQDRLRTEIREAEQASHGELDYEQLFALPYLDAVVRETLRLYPPVATAIRTARRDSILPLSKPITTLNGKGTQEVFVPKGTMLAISIDAANTDPELWGPDAFEFKPERWLSPLPKAMLDARVPGVYSHMMTFIGGGRACIGFKFAELEMKVIMFALLSKLQFKPGKQEVFWNMEGLATPSVDRTEARPQMPILVSRAT